MTAWQIAIETCMRQGSVALLREDRLIEQILLPAESRTAQSLAPAIARLIALPPRGRRDVGLVSAAVGPGSFTGIRIGVTAAKALAYALGCPVAPCDTLAAIIDQIRRGVPATSESAAERESAVAGESEWQETGVIDAAINAYRGQVYCRRETRSGNVLVASQAKDREAWLESLRPGPAEPITVAGDVWAQLDPLPVLARRSPASLGHPMAATIGRLGWEVHQRGEAIDPMRLQPTYLRVSAAEETSAAKKASAAKRTNTAP